MTIQRSAPYAPLSADASDADLMQLLAEGHPEAMDLLYDRYHRPVFSFALRMMGDRDQAEEVLQEVYLRAWRRASRFTDARGSLISWLLSITHNMAIDEIRKQQRRPQKQQAEDQTELMISLRDDGISMDTHAILTERRESVRRAMEQLPQPQREVLELAYFNGLTQREISDLLDTPLGTIKTRMRLALRKLQESVELQSLEAT